MVMQFERVGQEIFVRTKPHMGFKYPLSARRLCWPPPRHAWYASTGQPRLPAVSKPALLPLQQWHRYRELRVSVCFVMTDRSHIVLSSHLHQASQLLFYNELSWGIEPSSRVEMLRHFARWEDDPSNSAGWTLPLWPRRWEVMTHTHEVNIFHRIQYTTGMHA